MFAQKLLNLLKQPEPINQIPVTSRRNGVLRGCIEQYLSNAQNQ